MNVILRILVWVVKKSIFSSVHKRFSLQPLGSWSEKAVGSPCLGFRWWNTVIDLVCPFLQLPQSFQCKEIPLSVKIHSKRQIEIGTRSICKRQVLQKKVFLLRSNNYEQNERKFLISQRRQWSLIKIATRNLTGNVILVIEDFISSANGLQTHTCNLLRSDQGCH